MRCSRGRYSLFSHIDEGISQQECQEHTLRYLLPSQLADDLKSLQRLDSIDLRVISREVAMLGDSFPYEPVVLVKGMPMLDYGADGAVLYGGSPLQAVFEEFYLGGVISSGEEEIRLIPENCFATLVRSVGYGGWYVDAFGNPARDIVDYNVMARPDGWRAQLVGSAKSLVGTIAHASGVMPFLLFDRIGLTVFEHEMEAFLGSGDYLADPDKGFQCFID